MPHWFQHKKQFLDSHSWVVPSFCPLSDSFIDLLTQGSYSLKTTVFSQHTSHLLLYIFVVSKICILSCSQNSGNQTGWIGHFLIQNGSSKQNFLPDSLRLLAFIMFSYIWDSSHCLLAIDNITRPMQWCDNKVFGYVTKCIYLHSFICQTFTECLLCASTLLDFWNSSVGKKRYDPWSRGAYILAEGHRQELRSIISTTLVRIW